MEPEEGRRGPLGGEPVSRSEAQAKCHPPKDASSYVVTKSPCSYVITRGHDSYVVTKGPYSRAGCFQEEGIRTEALCGHGVTLMSCGSSVLSAT